MPTEHYEIKYRWKDRYDTRVKKNIPTLEEAKAWVDFVKDGLGHHEFIRVKVDDNGTRTAEPVTGYQEWTVTLIAVEGGGPVLTHDIYYEQH